LNEFCDMETAPRDGIRQNVAGPTLPCQTKRIARYADRRGPLSLLVTPTLPNAQITEPLL
jgi:hypothetical protein